MLQIIKRDSGMTLLGVLMAIGIVAIISIPVLFLMRGVWGRYGKVVAKKAIFPLADELRNAVAMDMKTFFTSERPNPPCSGGPGSLVADLPLKKSQQLRSGIQLNVLTSGTAAALPGPTVAKDFVQYNQAVKFCREIADAPPNQLQYPPVDFAPLPASGPLQIFNPTPADFSDTERFDFCATITCPTNPTSNFDKLCQYTKNTNLPTLAVFRYVIRNSQTGAAYSCGDSAYNWPSKAVGELSYLILWGRSNGTGLGSNEHFVDAGIFHSNKAN